jgi:hypothetical protein
MLFESYMQAVTTSNDHCRSDFVYVPLHYEPERTSNPDGGDFYSQYEMVRALRDFLPSTVTILLKEHPSTFFSRHSGELGRSRFFYNSLSALHNTKLVSTDVDSIWLIKNALFVSTLTGTAALEATLVGKKAIYFGCPWFQGCAGVYNFKLETTYESFMKKQNPTRTGVLQSVEDLLKKGTIGAINPSNKKLFNALGFENFELDIESFYLLFKEELKI